MSDPAAPGRRPALTRAQKEALAVIQQDTHEGRSWLNPRNLPHWVKNPWQVCQILERKGYVESRWVETAVCYRPLLRSKDRR